MTWKNTKVDATKRKLIELQRTNIFLDDMMNNILFNRMWLSNCHCCGFRRHRCFSRLLGMPAKKRYHAFHIAFYIHLAILHDNLNELHPMHLGHLEIRKQCISWKISFSCTQCINGHRFHPTTITSFSTRFSFLLSTMNINSPKLCWRCCCPPYIEQCWLVIQCIFKDFSDGINIYMTPPCVLNLTPQEYKCLYK